MASMLQTLFWWIAVLCFVQQTRPQTFTEYEKDEMLRRHIQMLMKESLRIFDGQMKWNDYRSRFQKAINYEGFYENINITEVKMSTMSCSDHLPQLIGFDYKRHDNKHHLLCFDAESLLVRVFRVVGTRVALEPASPLTRLNGVKQALFFRQFDTNKLFVAVLTKRGALFAIKTFEVNNGELEERIHNHDFEIFEQVVKIEVLHYDLHKYRLVALVQGNELSVKQDKQIIKITMPNAKLLETMRIQTQGILIASNQSYWCAYSYQDSIPQMIISYGSNSVIVDMKTLTTGTRHYIVVAAQHDQMVYRWDGQIFKGTAKMVLHRVYKINMLTVSNFREDHFFYFDQNNTDVLNMYSYSVNQKMFFRLKQISKRALNLPYVLFDPNYGNHFSERDVAFEFKLSNSLIYVIAYRTSIEITPKENIQNIVGEDNGREQIKVENKLGNIKQNLVSLESVETISKHNVNVTFNFAVQFKLSVDVISHESQDNIPKYWIINNATMDQDKLFVPLEELDRRISNVKEWNQRVEYDLNNEVVYKSSNVNITGFKEFVHGMFCSQIDAQSILIDYYRNKYMNQLLSGLYRITTNLPINGTKTLLGETSVNSFLRVNRLNQVRPKHFLYGNLEQVINSNLWYKKMRANLLLISDQLAPNISLSKAIFINQNGYEPIEILNRVLFTDLNIDNLQVDKIDDLSMSNFGSQVLRKNEHRKQTFKIATQMDVMNAHSELHTKMLNDHQTAKVFANLVSKSGKSHLEKPVIFNGDAHFRFLNLKGKMNGIRVPEDLLDKYSQQIVRGAKKFAHVSMKNLKTDTLNGVKIPKDIITLSSHETISGHLYLDSLQLYENLLVDGLIDKVNMTHLDQRYISSLKNNYHNLTFRKPVYVKRLKLNGNSNGLHIEDIYRDSVFNNSQNVNMLGPKTITSMLKCGSINAVSVNRQNISSYVTTNDGAYFPQRVTFKQPVQFVDVMLRSTFDGVPVVEILENAASLDGHQVIYGQKNFKETVSVQELFVEGSINRIRPENFMRYSQEQNITGRKSFSDAQVARVHSLSDLALSASINNFNFTQMMNNLVWLNRHQVVKGNIHCANCSSSRIETIYVNSKNFTYFYENYLSKSMPQTIKGNKNFKVIQNFQEIKTRHGIAGINMSKIHDEAITLHGHNVIRNSLIIHSDLQLRSGLLTAKDFNGIDINEYYRNVVHNNHSRVEIHGKIIYQKGFDLHADLDVSRLNHKVPAELLMTTKGNHEVTSNMHFTGRVITSGNVRVNAKVNGIDLVQLNQNILKVNDRGQVDGSVIFVQSVGVGELVVLGKVDGILLDRKSVLLKNSQQNLKQMVLNGPVQFKQSLNVWTTINGFHQDNLNKIVLIDSTQTQMINTTKTFGSIEATEIVQMKGDVHIKVINGMNMTYFNEHAVFASNNQTIRVAQHFLQNVTLSTRQVTVLGRVNKVDLLTDVIRLDSVNQTITGVKTFESVNFDSDIEIHGHVNGLDLRAVNENILSNIGRQTFTQRMTFNGPIYLSNDSIVDSINNFEPQNLIRLGDNQQVKGELQFGEIQTKHIDSTFVNRVNFTDISEHVLYQKSNKPQNVPGTIIVNFTQFDRNVNLKYHLNNVDLNVAVETANLKLNQNFDIQEVTNIIQNHTNKLYQQRSSYEYANFEIEYLQPSSISIPRGLTEKIIFDSKLKQRAQDVFSQVIATLGQNTVHQHQPFIFGGGSHVAIFNDTKEGTYLQILHSESRYKLNSIYRKPYPPGSKLLVFVMEESIYVLYGEHSPSPDCHYQAASNLERLTFSRFFIMNSSIVQQFNEPNVNNLGHYVDDSGYHYIVFNSHQIGMERLIKVYKRYNQCRFELFQMIPAQNVEKIALFKFGISGLMEQYLLLLENRHLTLWKQQGILGYSQNWSIRTSINRTSDPFELRPLVLNSRLVLFAPTCPVNTFEAQFNGQFYNPALTYDDFI